MCVSLRRKRREEYRRIVGDKVVEAKWKGLGENDHWQQMKGTMMETAQDISGMTKGPCRHKETWWWNEDVAEAVREKKIMYRKWKKKNTKEAYGIQKAVYMMTLPGLINCGMARPLGLIPGMLTHLQGDQVN